MVVVPFWTSLRPALHPLPGLRVNHQRTFTREGEREREIKREGERHIGFFNSNVGNIMRNRNLNVYMNIFLKHDAAMLLVESLHPKLCCRWGRNIIVLYSVKVM